MPKPKYFARLAGAFVIGLASLVLATLLFFFLIPFLLPVAPLIVPVALAGAFLVIVFFALWGIVYVSMIIGTAIIYLFRPMEVSRQDKRYSSGSMKLKEAGRREKGDTKGRK